MYCEDLAHMLARAASNGGYVYESGTGSILHSGVAMTLEELEEHWKYVDALSAYIEAKEYEYDGN